MQNDGDFVDVICYNLEDVSIKPHHANEHTEHKSSVVEAYWRWKTYVPPFGHQMPSVKVNDNVKYLHTPQRNKGLGGGGGGGGGEIYLLIFVSALDMSGQ